MMSVRRGVHERRANAGLGEEAAYPCFVCGQVVVADPIRGDDPHVVALSPRQELCDGELADGTGSVPHPPRELFGQALLLFRAGVAAQGNERVVAELSTVLGQERAQRAGEPRGPDGPDDDDVLVGVEPRVKGRDRGTPSEREIQQCPQPVSAMHLRDVGDAALQLLGEMIGEDLIVSGVRIADDGDGHGVLLGP